MREGRQHSLYINRQTRKSAAVPRLERFPREQFEAFAALLEFRHRSEMFRHMCQSDRLIQSSSLPASIAFCNRPSRGRRAIKRAA